MSAKSLAFLSVVVAISLLVGACGQNAPATSAPEAIPATPTQPPPSPTPEPKGLSLGKWMATADFGGFSFEVVSESELVIGPFDFPSGFACGTSKVTGKSIPVFDISTDFPPASMFGAPPPTPTVQVVKFQISQKAFSSGPFWIAFVVPTTKQRMPVMTMTLEGQFDSDSEASGKYQADSTKYLETTELQGVICSGSFTANWSAP